jgi:hypothetical protein
VEGKVEECVYYFSWNKAGGVYLFKPLRGHFLFAFPSSELGPPDSLKKVIFSFNEKQISISCSVWEK